MALLSAEFMYKLENLSLVSRRMHRHSGGGRAFTRRRGSSLDFADYRQYQAGDDFRYIDWNLYSRLGRLFVKLFRAEEDLSLHILIDTSLSMGLYGKLDWARQLAAAIGYIAIQRQGSVGVHAFSDRIADSLPTLRRKGAVRSFFSYLEKLTAEGCTRFSESLEQHAQSSRYPGIALVLSDLLDPAGYETGIDALLYRGFDVMLVQVLAPEELDPPDRGSFELQDVETGELLQLDMSERLRREYLSGLESFFERTGYFAMQRGIEYLRTSTDTSVEDVVFDYLQRGMFLTGFLRLPLPCCSPSPP